MSYIGNNPVNQNFVAGADQFSGTGSQLAFTLSRNVNTVFDMFVTVSNVPQDPFTAYTVAGNTLTFDSAPPSGTNNIDVVYRATNVQTFVPSPGVSSQFGLGSAASPSMTFIGDTNTGIYSPGADTLAFVEGGTEAMRIDSSANVGIGTSTPLQKLQVSGNVRATSFYVDGGAYVSSPGSDILTIFAGSAERARFGNTGDFQFNSGYGSVATAYGCRAWVNVSGATSPGTIRASGNVTSVTKAGTGNYTVNFTTAMPDANYSAVIGLGNDSGSTGAGWWVHRLPTFAAGSCQVLTGRPDNGVYVDAGWISMAFFR